MNKIYNPFSQPAFSVDWDSVDSEQLSINLNNQVRNNYMDLRALKFLCQESDLNMGTIVTIDNEVYIKSLHLSKQQKQEACQNFLQWNEDYTEVISRDQDALTYDDVRVQLYALVLIYDGVYQGHIYSWLSPYDPNYCFAMGIRNRVDSIFTRYQETNLKNISHYLIEGVRRFALSKGTSNIIITYPKPIMEKILPTLGFERISIANKLMGASIAPGSFGNCTNCYQLIDILKPIATNDMIFLLIDWDFKFYYIHILTNT